MLDAESVASWRPPKGMTARIERFEPREGGGYRMALIYDDPTAAQGKTSAREDVVDAVFVELIPYERIVEDVTFETADPALRGPMRITTTLTPAQQGTKVTYLVENVPPGISPEDHQTGMDSTLKNLAAFIE